ETTDQGAKLPPAGPRQNGRIPASWRTKSLLWRTKGRWRGDQAGLAGRQAAEDVRLTTRLASRDLYRAAALRWMTPLPAILSTSEIVLRSAVFTCAGSPESMAVRIWRSAPRRRLRSSRLCSRRTTF